MVKMEFGYLELLLRNVHRRSREFQKNGNRER